ncbi:MAG: recombinase family protein [Planctomycetota bacterium]
MKQENKNDEVLKIRRACGLYLRVSTERQALIKEGSLDTQQSTLTKYTEIKTSNSNEEWYVAEIYREEGKSGKNTDRPEYQKMLKDIKSGKLNVLLCTKIDRIHRSLMDFYKLHELLETHNVTFVSLGENWDTSTPMGRFGLKLTLAVAELEREQTSQRTKDKLRWRSEQGLWNGGQVLGYDVDPDEKGVLKINPQEAKIILLIFETYRELRSFRQTSQKMNQSGYRTKAYQSRRGHIHGNRKFTKNAIAHVLQNPVYIGKVSHKGDVFEGRQKPIIDEKLWKDANDHMASNRVIRRKPRPQKMHTFLLEGLLRCGWCGGYLTPTYSGGRSDTYFYYQCTSINNGADECKMRRVSAEALEDAIARRLTEMGKDKNLINDILVEANSNSEKECKILEERKELQKKALAPIEQEIKNIVKFIAQGKSSVALAAELELLYIQKM